MQGSRPDAHGIPNTVAILFSGGRDSTLAAAYYAEHRCRVHLLTFENFCQHATDITATRVTELRHRWPQQIDGWSQLSANKLLRDIALIELVTDIDRYHCNLVCLGTAFAMTTSAVDYCAARSIPVLATGYSGYQAHFPEQSPSAIEFWQKFAERHGISFQCPMTKLRNEQQARDLLESFGLSSKALEANGLWDWTYAEDVEPTVIQEYLSSKRHIADQYLRTLQDFRNAPEQTRSQPS